MPQEVVSGYLDLEILLVGNYFVLHKVILIGVKEKDLEDSKEQQTERRVLLDFEVTLGVLEIWLRISNFLQQVDFTTNLYFVGEQIPVIVEIFFELTYEGKMVLVVEVFRLLGTRMTKGTGKIKGGTEKRLEGSLVYLFVEV